MNRLTAGVVIALGLMLMLSPLAPAQITAEHFTSAQHPRVFATSKDRAELAGKIERVAWAKRIYDSIRARVDPLVDRHQSDPQFVVSRLQMHWDDGKHYTRFFTEGNFIPRREGNATYPTVRLMYGRSAKDSIPPPGDLSKLQPYGNGDLPRLKDGVWETVPFEKTQLGAEDVNKTLINHAYHASIVYYLTGDKRYAKFAADIIWTFVRGAAQQEPVNPDTDGGPSGYLSWETLGDTRRFTTLPLAYDFIHDYLVNEYFDSDEFRNGRAGELWAPGHPQGKAWAMQQFERMFKKFIDNKLTRGGGLQGNWNTNEHESAMLYALAMENDSVYSDGKGREYYVNRLVYGPTDPARHGAYVDVAKANISPETGLWPEPPGGYGQGSIQQLVRFGYIYFVNGLDLIEREPLLKKAAVSFPQMAFPNGFSTGWGDTNYNPIFTEQAELMIAYARAKGDEATEKTFTALLAFAGDRKLEGMYEMPLFFFVPELKPVTEQIQYPRVSYSPALSIIFERNLGATANDSLAYTVSGSGSRSGHRQANGMTLELFGRGHVLGVDPGWGPDYWVAQHTRYNSQIAAHNTVVPNGLPQRGPLDLKIEHAEPPVQAGVDPQFQLTPLFQFTDTSADFRAPDAAADQRRLVGLIRTSDRGGYFIDIFRSRMRESAETHHDYLYHNMGVGVKLSDDAGHALPLPHAALDPQSGFGYEFFQDHRSLPYEKAFRATFDFGADETMMHLHMLGGEGRTIYSLTAPNNHRFYLNSLKQIRVPTVLVRQSGEAWDRPFVAVYEPAGNGAEPAIRTVRQLEGNGSFVGVFVEHSTPGRVDRVMNCLDAIQLNEHEGIRFRGIYAVVRSDDDGPTHLYLGSGRELSAGGCSIEAAEPEGLVQASLMREGAAYTYSASREILIRIPGRAPARVPAAVNAPLK